MEWIGAAAQSASDLTSTGLNLIFQRKANEAAQDFQRSQSATAYQQDLQMWNMNNEYNSPKAQMKRLEEAGLNPMLMYGQGNVGNSTTMPRYQPAQGQFIAPRIQLPDVLGLYQSVMNFKKDQDLKEQLILTQKEEVDKRRIQNIVNTLDLFYKAGFRNFDQLPQAYKDQVAQLMEDYKSLGYVDKYSGKGLRDYQLENAEKYGRNLDASTTERLGNVNLKKWLADWQQKKVNYWEQNKINIDKDAYLERSLQDLLGGAGVSGKYVGDFIKIISLMMGK